MEHRRGTIQYAEKWDKPIGWIEVCNAQQHSMGGIDKVVHSMGTFKLMLGWLLNGLVFFILACQLTTINIGVEYLPIKNILIFFCTTIGTDKRLYR